MNYRKMQSKTDHELQKIMKLQYQVLFLYYRVLFLEVEMIQIYSSEIVKKSKLTQRGNIIQVPKKTFFDFHFHY